MCDILLSFSLITIDIIYRWSFDQLMNLMPPETADEAVLFNRMKFLSVIGVLVHIECAVNLMKFKYIISMSGSYFFQNLIVRVHNSILPIFNNVQLRYIGL